MQRYALTQGLEAAESRLLLCQIAGIGDHNNVRGFGKSKDMTVDNM